MLKGIDTTFLVEAEVLEAPRHQAVRTYLDEKLLGRGQQLALAPQVICEFVHIVTDDRRFERPLSVLDALARAQLWWQAREVRQVYPGAESVSLLFEWLERFKLGRKRLLDTQLAATYHAAGIVEILTSNARDFSTFGCFKVIVP